jgi:hypothetical protein
MPNYRQPSGYYVYYYLRSKDSACVPNAPKGTPYYVGKGKGRRAWTKHKTAQRPKDLQNILVICEGLTEDQALQIEILHIKLWGRIASGTGILRNLTDGGEGASGYKQPKHVIEKRVATRKANNWGHTDETKEVLRQKSTGRKHTDETKQLLSELGTGLKRSEETCKKISIAKTGVPKPMSARILSSQIQKGRKQPPELVEKRRLAQIAKGMSDQGKAAVTLNALAAASVQRTCPHCGKTGKGGSMLRWHFDACKMAPLTCEAVEPS